MQTTDTQFSPRLHTYIQEILSEISNISDERKGILLPVADFVREELSNRNKAELIFICTHNSRRSHFGQVWGQTMARYFGLKHVYTYSGGTEATAFNPNAIDALKNAGFVIESENAEESNPEYHVHYSKNEEYMKAWSKVYSDQKNPQSDFGAIMTCDEANEACPIVMGASTRFPVTYQDPKKSDGTPEQAATYQLRCRQIATEMAFVFSQVSR